MKFIATILLLMVDFIAFAQKQRFDIAYHLPPEGWKTEKSETVTGYSRIDGGSWAQIKVYASTASRGSIASDSDSAWFELITRTHKMTGDAKKTDAQTNGEWSVASRSGVWQYNGQDVATILTTYSNGIRCFSIVFFATAKPYLKEYETFIAGLSVIPDEGGSKKSDALLPPAQPDPNTSASRANTDGSTTGKYQREKAENIVLNGLWRNNLTETSGYFNGKPVYTAGYSIREYTFNQNGTYRFIQKVWLTTLANIVFTYETGTYTISMNKLILNPQKAKTEEWSKKGMETNQWGRLIKSESPKLTQSTYTFERYTDDYGTTLELLYASPNAREPGNLNKLTYSLKTTEDSLITLPPGFKF